MMGLWKERWRRGEKAWFEYHCQQSHDSGDAQLWYRCRQQVTVLGVADCEHHGGPLADRMRDALPLVYDIRFADGYEDAAFEDELMLRPHWDSNFRPPPPEEIP